MPVKNNSTEESLLKLLYDAKHHPEQYTDNRCVNRTGVWFNPALISSISIPSVECRTALSRLEAKGFIHRTHGAAFELYVITPDGERSLYDERIGDRHEAMTVALLDTDRAVLRVLLEHPAGVQELGIHRALQGTLGEIRPGTIRNGCIPRLRKRHNVRIRNVPHVGYIVKDTEHARALLR